ncbi:MAG: hypothetical protein ACK5L6_13955 [Anaerorhabdus sp.]|uniref:hypothetical protein n=1 Tax=Anaerorhabdus sp. TaxID=1872524 RepID=UPI003A8920A2
MDLPKGLLELVKNRNDYTWEDTALDKKLTIIIENGIAEINGLNGLENDFMKAGKAQKLLLSYVMYDLSNCLDDFKVNYKSDIVSFINKARAKRYAESKANDSV